MSMNTPPLPRTKNMRWAAALNLFLPGAGLFYLGRRKTGAALGIAFLFCLAAALGTFLTGYVHYLNVVLGGDLMQEGQIEQLKDVFHKSWLVGLGIAGVSLEIISMIELARARSSQREGAPLESPPTAGR
jgi:hypothetical protein